MRPIELELSKKILVPRNFEDRIAVGAPRHDQVPMGCIR